MTLSSKLKLGFLVVLCLFLTSCGSKKVEPGALIELTPSQLLEKINNNEHFIVFVGATWCPHCVEEYKPTVLEVVEEKGVDMYMLMSDLHEQSEVQFLLDDYQLEYLPTTYVFKDGEMTYINNGVVSKKDLVKLFKDNKLLP